MGFNMYFSNNLNLLIMNIDILYLITFISLIFYGYNLLADLSYDRPLSSHMGYGLISIIGLWQIIPALAIGILIIFSLHQAVLLAIWVETKRKLRHDAHSNSRREEIL